MKNKKLALLLMCGLMGLAACGGTSSGTSSSPTSDSPVSTGPATDSTGGSTGDSSGTSDTPAVVSVSISGATEVTSGQEIALTATVTGSDNKNVTWSSSNTAVATVNSQGTVFAATGILTETAVTITATSVADNSKSATHVVTVKPVEAPVPDPDEFSASIVISQFSDESQVVETMVEGTGAYMMRVELENLPDGKSLSDCTFTWPHNTAVAAYADASANGKDANYRVFTVWYAGTEEIEVTVECDGESAVAKKTVEVTKNDALYTEISTAAQFINLLEGTSNLEGRYKLTANLDLGGYESTSEARNTTLNAIIDGDGHTISNFVTKPHDNNTGGGLFKVIGRGIIRNTHFIGKVNAFAGWGGLLSRENSAQSIIENCIVEAENISTIGGDWTWQRNGGVTGCLKGALVNVVALATANTGTATIDDQLLAIAPYAYSNNTDAFPSMKNVFTNKSADLSVPFAANGEMVNGQTAFAGGYTPDIDFTNVSASVFSALPTSIWTIADNAVPALAHDGETPDVVAPQVTVNAASKSMRADATYEIVAEAKFFSATPTITYTSSNTAAATVDANGLVTGVAEGETTITVKATAGAQEATATVVITVTSAAEPVPDVSNKFVVSNIHTVGGAWLRYTINIEDGTTITAADVTVDWTKNVLNFGDSSSVAGQNQVEPCTVNGQELKFGAGYRDAGFMIEGNVTSLLYITVGDVEYCITTEFTSNTTVGDQDYPVVSSSCAIVE